MSIFDENNEPIFTETSLSSETSGEFNVPPECKEVTVVLCYDGETLYDGLLPIYAGEILVYPENGDDPGGDDPGPNVEMPSVSRASLWVTEGDDGCTVFYAVSLDGIEEGDVWQIGFVVGTDGIPLFEQGFQTPDASGNFTIQSVPAEYGDATVSILYAEETVWTGSLPIRDGASLSYPMTGDGAGD